MVVGPSYLLTVRRNYVARKEDSRNDMARDTFIVLLESFLYIARDIAIRDRLLYSRFLTLSLQMKNLPTGLQHTCPTNRDYKPRTLFVYSEFMRCRV